jgi:hypothetical protein
VPWTWAFEPADPAKPVDPPASQEFPTQADAETWLGESWRELRADGVTAVTLLEEERVVYGPMPLDA